MTQYLLDANVFIAAKNLHYGFDFCPAFWDWIIREHAAGNVMSIERVYGELQAGDDDLARWAAQRGSSFFLRPDASVIPELGSVSNWANSQSYEPAAVSTFLQVADFYFVAQARAGGHTVVTHERPDAFRRRTIKIPDACIALGIHHVTPFEMLRRERARFTLGPNS